MQNSVVAPCSQLKTTIKSKTRHLKGGEIKLREIKNIVFMGFRDSSWLDWYSREFKSVF